MTKSHSSKSKFVIPYLWQFLQAQFRITFLHRVTHLIIFVCTRYANRAQTAGPISTVSSCSWNNRKYMKWEIAHPDETRTTTPRLHAECPNRWASGMWHFPIPVSDTCSGDNDIFAVKFNPRNAKRARTTAPIPLWAKWRQNCRR